MTISNGHHRKSERRQHPRFPVLEGLIEPITLRYTITETRADAKKDKSAPEKTHNQPAILTDLSAGGMSLITFVEPPHTKILQMDLCLPGLSHVPVHAKVVRVHTKGETYNVGIQFTRIPKKYQKQINDMAMDHIDCDTRISLSLPEACVPNCRFNHLCQKTQKAPHWPPKV